MGSRAARHAAIAEMFSAIEERWGSIANLKETGLGIDRLDSAVSGAALER